MEQTSIYSITETGLESKGLFSARPSCFQYLPKVAGCTILASQETAKGRTSGFLTGEKPAR